MLAVASVPLSAQVSDVVLTDSLWLRRHGLMLGSSIYRDSTLQQRLRQFMDTVNNRITVTPVSPDTVSHAVMDTAKTGVHLPRLREFREIHRNDALTGLEKVKHYGNFFVRVIDAFDNIDERYVERIGYNFTAMLQGTTNFEFYNIGTPDYGESMTLAQHPDFRVGPYVGWKWLFLGYTFDVTHIGSRKRSGSRFELSIYTSMIGIDLIRRSTGNDFFLLGVRGLGDDAKAHVGEDCEYLNTKVIGANVYYNFNHRRFSSPAVFSQSTIQRRSAGSWQLGFGITVHDVKFDFNSLPADLLQATDRQDEYASLERIKYWDYSLTFGYAYNWVPARNWCVGMAVTPSLSYKHATSQTAILHEDAMRPTMSSIATVPSCVR